MIAMLPSLSVCLLVINFCLTDATLPSYIKPCKRTDAGLNECVKRTFEDLRPHLKQGIPELNVPPIDPLFLPEIVVAGSVEKGRGQPLRAVATNVKVLGAGDYKVQKLVVDLKKTIYYVNMTFPFLKIEANYDMDAKILNIPLKGRGPLKANATNVRANIVLHGAKVKIEGTTHIQFHSMETDLRIGDYKIRLFNLFNGDPTLNNAINAAINENKQEFMKTLKPLAEDTVAKYILENLNKIFSKFTFEEFFPK
ncbi:unnamed protein product [Bemisia tabaci]|uniref:Protein takeout n=1 Tax=Bemisia tabaci TaxID=7038 RepID=A0A9P0F0X2_BEMTA|nr:unnamed protein product [Bemisia tabaci]